MSYIALSCFSSKVPLKDTNKPKVLETDEKATIITDIVVAVLISTVGVLALIQITGLASLSYLSCLGAVGSKAAYAMIGVGAGIAAIDLIKFMIQQARHISKLQSLESTRNSEREQREEKLSIQIRESAQSQLEAQRKPYEKHIRGEGERTRKAIEEATEELTDQIAELQAQLKIARQEAEKPLQEEIEKLKGEQADVVKHAVEEASKELNGRIEILQKQLVSAKEEAKKPLLEEIEKLTKEYDKAVRAAVEKAEKPFNERIRKLEQEELEARARLKLEGGLEEIRRQVEDAKDRQSKSALVTKETLAKLEEEKLQLEETIRQMELHKQELEHSKKKHAVPESDPVKKAPTPTKAPELPKLEPSEPEKILAPAIAPAVAIGLNHSLLVRVKLNLSSQLKAPQMESGAKKTILRLVETKMGLQKIKGAVFGFQEYLEEKVEGLKAKPSSDPMIGDFQKALTQDLMNSSIDLDDEDELPSLDYSFMAPVCENIDLEDLEPSLETYFITLAEWIKKVEEPEEQIKRIEVAMEQFTYELVDVVTNQSEKAKLESRARLESEGKRIAEAASQEEEIREVTQKGKIKSALIYTFTAADRYDLRTLDFSKVSNVGKTQIQEALQFKKNGGTNLMSVKETIETLEALKEELLNEADRLLALDLKKDRADEIEALQKQSGALISHIEKFKRCRQASLDTILIKS